MVLRTLTTILAGIGMASSGPALAGPLLITPTTVQFETGRRSAAVEITNESDNPVDLQFRAFAWDQPDGRERLTPTQALAISPPIATIPPRGKQVFRVLDLSPADAPGEQSYRLKLNELPRSTGDAVAINLEFSLPVFRTPVGGAPQMDGSINGGEIRVANLGGRRVRMTALMLQQADGTQTPLPTASATYILTNSARNFALPFGLKVAAGARLRGASDAGPIDVPLAVAAAR